MNPEYLKMIYEGSGLRVSKHSDYRGIVYYFRVPPRGNAQIVIGNLPELVETLQKELSKA